jgi:hypothetical protein
MILTFLLSFISCGKKIDTSVWLTSFEDAKKAAEKENKLIFIFFSEIEADNKSARLKENLFDKEDFIKTYTEKYVLLNLDYSNSRNESDAENLSSDMRIFESYDVKDLPYFLIVSPQGYVIEKLAFDASADIDTAKITFGDVEDSVREFKENLAAIKNGTKEEKLEAIDKIYEKTPPTLTYHIRDLSEKFLSLDKNNETGKYLKHAISLTYAKAQEYFMKGEEEKGCDEFIKLAENKNLTDDDRQMAYYTAGYLLASSGSQNFEKIIGYFKQSYEINPESESASNIKMSIDYVQTLIDGEAAE